MKSPSLLTGWNHRFEIRSSVPQPRRRFLEHKNREAGYAARSKGSLKGSFCPRPGFQRTLRDEHWGGFRRVIFSARNYVKNSVKLCAERAPETSPDSDLSYRKQTYSRPYTCPVNRRVVGSSPTSGAIKSVISHLFTGKDTPCSLARPIQYSAFSPFVGTEVGRPGVPA